MENIIDEIWKDIEGYHGIYQVSNFGRVKSLSRLVAARNNKTKRISEKIVKSSLSKNGYLYITLKKHEVLPKTFYTHRLVCTAFIINDENKLTVNHKDGNKQNNHVDNLEWNTYSENNNHAYSNGLKNKLSGEINGRSKLIAEDVVKIRYLYDIENISKRKLQEMFSVSKSTIQFIVENKTWTHI